MKTKNNIFGLECDPAIRHNYIDRISPWVDDVPSPKGMPESSYISSNLDTKKIRYFILFAFLILTALFGRIFYLQIMQGNEYRIAAEENRVRIKEIKAPRGLIYDRDGHVLAHNIANFSLFFTPADLPDQAIEKNTIIKELASILSIQEQEIANVFNQAPPHSFQQILLADHVPYEKALQLQIAAANFSGISIEATTFREYTVGSFFSPILGYMGKITEDEVKKYPHYALDDYLGKSGIELTYEKFLHGESGKKEIEVDSRGKENKIISEQAPINGNNLYLTVDPLLQNTLASLLKKTVTSSKTITGAAAVAIDPRNGEVLALVTTPTYDSNAFTKGLSQEEYDQLLNDNRKPLINRAVSGEYPSGSTIKPLLALAALQEGIITPTTTVVSSGGIRVGQWFFPDWKSGGHGVTNVTKALAESVNTFFYAIGGGYEKIEGLGIDRIKRYLELFNLNAPLGIDIPSEASGFLPSKAWKEDTKNEKWYIGDTYHLSIGQGDLLVTPLQVTSYMATIANGGTLYKPHLVAKMTNSSGTTLQTFAGGIIRDSFIDAAHIKIVRNALREVVISGSGRVMADLPFTVAGKTGTAQFGNEGKSHAWFTCFAPFENPEIALTVLIEQGGEGNVTALPIAHEALRTWFSEK
ncbi:MAG: penicillin-binding protein 2 [Patescibacteria group bacterium]|nr:penicillin-binding protein 2 [Patescibacteria group bacterium]